MWWKNGLLTQQLDLLYSCVRRARMNVSTDSQVEFCINLSANDSGDDDDMTDQDRGTMQRTPRACHATTASDSQPCGRRHPHVRRTNHHSGYGNRRSDTDVGADRRSRHGVRDAGRSTRRRRPHAIAFQQRSEGRRQGMASRPLRLRDGMRSPSPGATPSVTYAVRLRLSAPTSVVI